MAQGEISITPNQVVAFNLKKLRETRKLTQDQAAEKLSRFLPGRWSKQAFSNAERSVEGKRIKQFTADEIVAITRAFDVTLSDLFAPPYEVIHGRPVIVNQPGLPRDRALEPHQLDLLVMGEVAPPRSPQEAAYAFALLIAVIENERRPSHDRSGAGPGRQTAVLDAVNETLVRLGLHPGPERAQGISRDLMRRIGSVADALDAVRALIHRGS
jgi:hypothetical protein